MSDSPIVNYGSAKTEYWFEERCFITEWLNDPNDPEISIARARVEPGVTTQWHCLRGLTERYLVLSGSGRAEIGESQSYELSAGDSVCIKAGQRQRITNTGESDLIFLAICTPRFKPGAYEQCD